MNVLFTGLPQGSRSQINDKKLGNMSIKYASKFLCWDYFYTRLLQLANVHLNVPTNRKQKAYSSGGQPLIQIVFLLKNNSSLTWTQHSKKTI